MAGALLAPRAPRPALPVLAGSCSPGPRGLPVCRCFSFFFLQRERRWRDPARPGWLRVPPAPLAQAHRRPGLPAQPGFHWAVTRPRPNWLQICKFKGARCRDSAGSPSWPLPDPGRLWPRLWGQGDGAPLGAPTLLPHRRKAPIGQAGSGRRPQGPGRRAQAGG